MQYECVIDIETIPAQSQAALDRAREEVKAPGNLKKQESIDDWLAVNREKAAMEAIAKTSFDPAQGHICTIAWAVDNDDPVARHAETVEQEAGIISEFFGALRFGHNYKFIGHYIGGFDLRFILCRAVVLGVKIPQAIPRDPKPWDTNIFDTMTAWAGARGSISMDNLAAALGLPGKDGFDGSMVASAWANGEHDRIAEYCKTDVINTREIYRKFKAVGW